MSSILLSFISVLMFCACAHFFVKAIVQPIPRLHSSDYSKVALKLRRQYQIFSLGVMTFTFLISLVISFIEVFAQL